MRKTMYLLLCVFVMMFSLPAGGCAGKTQNDSDVFEEFVGEEADDSKAGSLKEEKVLSDKDDGSSASEQESTAEDRVALTEAKEDNGRIFVHVCGQVCQPGVYELKVHSRVYEAIQAAGGMTQTAAFSYLNQAEELTDGQQLYVPSQEEITAWENGENTSGNQAFAKGATEGQSSENSDDQKGKSADDKVNLNTADQTELMTLNGIGEVRAKSILQYREEHGKFSAIDELKNVDGIGEKTYKKVESRIKI